MDDSSPSSSELFVVASLNLARTKDPSVVAEALRSSPVLRDADILLFQEVAGQRAAENVAKLVADQLGRIAVAIPSDAAAPNQGLAILGKHPLENPKSIALPRFNLRFKSRIRFAIAATAILPASPPVRLWNVHLDSRINPADRARQLAPLMEDAAQHSGSRIVAGDLNTTRFEWWSSFIPKRIGSSQIATVRRVFEESGFQSAVPDDLVTFPFLLQHLDWICARSMVAKDHGTVHLPFSDHLAVWASYHRPLQR